MGRVIHFELHAAEPARAIAFHERVFGWRFTRWGELDYWLVVTGSDSEAGINGGLVLRRGPPPTPGQPVNACVCTVDVADLDASLALALDAGASLALARMPVPGVGWLAYIHDTEGNLLGMMQGDPTAT